MRRLLLKNAAATNKFAVQLAKKILRSKVFRHRPLIISLVGDLGAGKTTFTQGFAKALGIKSRVISPTFLIFRRYMLNHSRFANFYHVDCYRIHKPRDLHILGFKKILKDPANIIVIEWADRIKKILPKDAIWLEFSHGRKETQRFVTH